MRVVFKTSYDRDIDLHKDGIHRARIAVLLAVMAALPFLVGTYYLAEATNTLIWALAGGLNSAAVSAISSGATSARVCRTVGRVCMGYS